MREIKIRATEKEIADIIKALQGLHAAESEDDPAVVDYLKRRAEAMGGKEIPVQRVHELDTVNGVLLLQASVTFTDEETRLRIEKDLTNRVGCPVVVLDNYLRVVGSRESSCFCSQYITERREEQEKRG